MAEMSPALGPPPPRRGGWFAMVIVGSLVTLIAGSQLTSALALAVWAGGGGREGFLSSPPLRASASVAAVTSTPLLLESSLPEDALPDIRFSLSAGRDGGDPIFIGIGPTADIEEYLEGSGVAQVWGVQGVPPELQTRVVPGGANPSPPGDQAFWAASESGTGVRDLIWTLEPGTWTVVLMNADGSAPVDTTIRVGIEAPWAGPLAAVLIVISLVTLPVGLALILAGVYGWGRARVAGPPPVAPYPAAVIGELRADPSRWLWLVKWVLIIPHWIVLSLLWVAFGVTTIAAGFAILLTGRYPRPFFDFAVGVLRWTWRVSFYAYSALGTDRYPPFSLLRTDFPADFDVAYPERLSRGLVLVKWWLLAIPHYLLIGAVTGGATWWYGSRFGAVGAPAGGLSLLGVLVLIAAVILLFSGRYQRPLFDVILGVNRWGYRVIAYVALMRDEYPPFRFDQGPREPSAVAENLATTITSER